MSRQPLSEDERAELERLRAGHGHRSSGRILRWTGAVVALVLSAVLAVASVVVVFAADELFETDRYTETVAPLSENPAVQNAVIARITDAVNDGLDLNGFMTEVIDSIQTRGAPDALDSLAGPVTSAVEGFIADQVAAVVHSEWFSQMWTNLNAVAHREVIAILQGSNSQLLSLQNDVLYIDLGEVVAEVKTRLVDRGLTIAEKLPDVSVEFPLMKVNGLANAQALYATVGTISWVLPLATLLLFIVGVVTAPTRRRGFLVGAVLIAAAMAGLLIAVALARTIMLARLPDTVRSSEAVAATYDILLRFLIDGAWTVLVLALVTAVTTWFLGPGRFATAVRGGFGRGFDLSANALSWTTPYLGGAATFTARNRRALEVGVVALSLLWLVLWPHRGVGGILWVSAVAIVVVALIELLGRTAPIRQGRT